LQGCDGISSSGSRSDEDDARLPARSSIPLSHVASALLMSGENEVEMGGLINSVEDG